MLKEDLVKFYAVQKALTLQHLHDLNIAYCDLKSGKYPDRWKLLY